VNYAAQEVAQNVAQGLAHDVAQDVAKELAFGGPGGAHPSRHAATTTAAASAQLAICRDGGAAGQLSGVWLVLWDLWEGTSGSAMESASIFISIRQGEYTWIRSGKIQLAQY